MKNSKKTKINDQKAQQNREKKYVVLFWDTPTPYEEYLPKFGFKTSPIKAMEQMLKNGQIERIVIFPNNSLADNKG